MIDFLKNALRDRNCFVDKQPMQIDLFVLREVSISKIT